MTLPNNFNIFYFCLSVKRRYFSLSLPPFVTVPTGVTVLLRLTSEQEVLYISHRLILLIRCDVSLEIIAIEMGHSYLMT